MNCPTCPHCGTKFPGDPCKKCTEPSVISEEVVTARAEEKASRMPSATRKRRKHGRPR